VWTPWKAALVRRLFTSVAARLGDGTPPGPSDLADRAAAVSGGRYDRRNVAEHVAAMPAIYAGATTPEDVVWHLDAVAAHAGPATIVPSSDDPRRVVVVGPDRRGFMLAVSRVFAANGVAVVDARLMTREDGLAVDTFRVHRDVDDEAVAAERWERVERDLRAVLDGELDIRPRLRDRVRTYAAAGGAVSVRPLPDVSSRHTVIEVRATDRVGLLADVVEALHSEGLDLHVARLDTRGADAVDVFHVRRLGVPIRVQPELQALCARVADRLRHARP
jgi:[protein-PII] uridylyltransferase